MSKLLVIDDDRTVTHVVGKWFDEEDIEVLNAADAEAGLTIIREEEPDAVLLDIMLPEISGLEAFQKIHALDSKLPVIFITGGGSSNTAIEAMKLGAYDYFLKPLDRAQVRKVVAEALHMRRMMRVPVQVSAGVAANDLGDQIVGRSTPMQDVFKSIGRVASQDVPVLIQGESGTGKELVARAIYHHSNRTEGPFMPINCAAIPETLLESEFFGHEKGAFTGAENQRIGKFEQCSGGTIFLDEIGDMPGPLQAKILRLLQDQQFERVGGNKTITTDVRIIAATNKELSKLVKEGIFREDLLYRLKGFLISLPPLRDRLEDLTLLLEHFLGKYRRSMGKEVESISNEALEVLQNYSWPGNVRELESVVKQAIIQATGSVITPYCLPDLEGDYSEPAATEPHQEAAPSGDGLPPSDLRPFVRDRLARGTDSLYEETQEFMERFMLTSVLRKTGGNQSQAAKILGITRGRLRNRIRSLGISVDSVVTVNGDEVDETEQIVP